MTEKKRYFVFIQNIFLRIKYNDHLLHSRFLNNRGIDFHTTQ